MATKVLNIELGDRITKVCVCQRKHRSVRMDDSFLLQTPSGLVRDGVVTDVAAMADALSDQLRAHGADGVKHVTFTLLSTKVASREIMLPPLKENRIKSVIQTNAADYFPVDMSRYCLSYNLLERPGGENSGCRVQVMAAPRSLLENYARLSEACGLTLDAVDYCGNSLYQVLRTLRGDGVTMYVDVNVSNTFVTFMNRDVMLLQRNISAGGAELISSALSAAQPGTDFLSVLQHASDGAYLDSLLPRSQQADCLSRLVGGVARSADFFRSSRARLPIARVVLTGVCGSLAGLRELLQAELTPEVTLLQEVEGVQLPLDSTAGAGSFLSCIGSLMAPLDLLPADLRSRKRLRAKRAERDGSFSLGAAICGVCVLLGVGLSVFSVVRYTSALRERDRLQARQEELAYVQQAYDTYTAYLTTQQTLASVREETGNNGKLVAFLEELERRMPSGMLLLSAVCDEHSVTMNIVTPDLTEADVVISQLRKFDSVRQLTVSAITETADDSGLVTASFSVNCGFDEPDAQDAAPDAPDSAN